MDRDRPLTPDRDLRRPGTQRAERRGDPTVAALLGWFVPGAGHLYVGELVAGGFVFLLVGGLFALGLKLSGGMTFEYLDPELRGALAPVLSPEAGNLGGFVWQLRHHGYGPGYPRAFPGTIRLGNALCGLSGILNVLGMVHVHLLARTGRVRDSLRPAALVGLAWLLPGLGHLAQGRRLRALIVFLLLVGLLVAGTFLAEASNLSRERHFYYWAGQFLLGAPALLAEALFGSMRITGHIPYAEAGLVYGCVAGLLNVLAMIDVYGWAEAQVLGIDPLDRGSGDRGSSVARETTRPSAHEAPAGPGLREEVRG